MLLVGILLINLLGFVDMISMNIFVETVCLLSKKDKDKEVLKSGVFPGLFVWLVSS